MRRIQVTLLASLAMLLLAGCVSLDIGNRSEPKHRPAPVEPVIVVPPGPRDAGTIAEIDAAARFTFDADKDAHLSAIASRPHLTPNAQIHLVNKAYASFTFQDHLQHVLDTVIQNPGFSDAGKEAVVTQLHRFTFDHNKTAVLNAIQKRELAGPLIYAYPATSDGKTSPTALFAPSYKQNGGQPGLGDAPPISKPPVDQKTKQNDRQPVAR